MWIGTDNGVARRLRDDTAGEGRWRYYAGKRWLPSARVSAIVPLRRTRAVLVVCDGGVAVLEAQARLSAEQGEAA